MAPSYHLLRSLLVAPWELPLQRPFQGHPEPLIAPMVIAPLDAARPANAELCDDPRVGVARLASRHVPVVKETPPVTETSPLTVATIEL